MPTPKQTGNPPAQDLAVVAQSARAEWHAHPKLRAEFSIGAYEAYCCAEARGIIRNPSAFTRPSARPVTIIPSQRGPSAPLAQDQPQAHGVERRLAAATAEQTARAQWYAEPRLRAEMSQDAYVAFCHAQAQGLVHIGSASHRQSGQFPTLIPAQGANTPAAAKRTTRVERRLAAETADVAARSEWSNCAALRAEMSQDAYVAFCRAQASGQVRRNIRR